MIPVPIDLPVRPSEAAALAELVIRHLGVRGLTDDARNRLAGEAGTLGLTSVRPLFGSLEADPVHQSVYYLAVDGMAQGEPEPLLLRLAPASSPASALFPGALLIGRMRPDGGREMVVNAMPFSPSDGAVIETYVEQVARVFLPRPQGSLPALTAGSRHPKISIPAAFGAYRSIFRECGLNMAAPVSVSAQNEVPSGPDGDRGAPVQNLYDSGLWAAVRAGWREGYAAELSGISVCGASDAELGSSIDGAKELIRRAANFSRFGIDVSKLLVDVDSWPASRVSEQFATTMTPDERRWLESEFLMPASGESALSFTSGELQRLAVRFGRALRILEELADTVRSVKSVCSGIRSVDLELSFAGATSLVSAKDLGFCLQWLKSRGRPVQFYAPNLGFRPALRYDGAVEDLGARVRELTLVARLFNVTLSFDHGCGKQEALLEEIGRATFGRFTYRLSAELELQLFDVLSELPPQTEWHELYRRMAERALRMAGAEKPGEGHFLGDPEDCRSGANPVLLTWIGRAAGAPDHDGVLFREKLEHLPADLVAEAQRRNTKYVSWVASHLR